MGPVEVPSVSVSPPRPAATKGGRGRTVVWVGGEHDIATRIELSGAIAHAAARDDSDVFVDLSAVTFMDASTIGAIVGGRNLLRSRSRVLSVRAPSARALRVLDLCGLGSLIEPRETAALATWVDVPAAEQVGRPERALAQPSPGSAALPGSTVDVDAMPAVETVRAGP